MRQAARLAPCHSHVLRLVGLAEAGDGQDEEGHGEGAGDADAGGVPAARDVRPDIPGVRSLAGRLW
jgi:hypothetical protein